MIDKDFTIYTDGGYSMKRDEGAFAFVILENGKIVKTGSKKVTGESNQRCEIKAIMNAVYNLPDGASAEVVTDSQYSIGVLDTKNSGWHPNANLDLVTKWYDLVREKGVSVSFRWVKGHSGDPYNEMCDRMCDDAVGYDLNAEFAKYRKKK